MCWFIYFDVVLQKDTPAQRARVRPPEEGSADLGGAFPAFTIPRGVCGCGFVEGQGGGIVAGAAAVLGHYLRQPAVKRVDVWWHWNRAGERARPGGEERMAWETFVGRNAAADLGPDCCYRLTDSAKFQHP